MKKLDTRIIFIVLSLVLVLLSAGEIIFFLQKSKTKKIETKQIQAQIPTLVPTLIPTIASVTTLNEKETPGKLDSLDTKWSVYKNDFWGFSIKLPKRVELNETLWGEIRVEPKGLNSILITSNINGPVVQTSERQTIWVPKWDLKIKRVSTDAQVETYIKENYGNACKFGEKKLLTEDTYEVTIKEDRTALGKPDSNKESICFIDEKYIIRYSPKKAVVVGWGMGQSPQFKKSIEPLESYDDEMSKSFRFDKN